MICSVIRNYTVILIVQVVDVLVVDSVDCCVLVLIVTVVC